MIGSHRSLALKVDYDLSAQKFELKLLDQTLLPQKEVWIQIKSIDSMIQAIKLLQVRGAPLIGVAAAFSLAQEAVRMTSEANRSLSTTELTEKLLAASAALRAARPTAVNLMNALDRMNLAIKNQKVGNVGLSNYSSTKPPQADYSAQQFVIQIVQEAVAIFNEDVELCEKIANSGVGLFQNSESILTHCNTGGLATAGIGTALGVLKALHERNNKLHVYVDETRPLLQGGRLTAWELERLGISYTLITDNMAASLMRAGRISGAIVGADRIAINGDFANKIGTYAVAVNCKYHQIPFFTAAPFTTVDPKCLSGSYIEVEQRDPDEVRGYVTSQSKNLWAPAKSNVFNPSFDVTPAELVSGWITDRGAFKIEDVRNGCFK